MVRGARRACVKDATQQTTHRAILRPCAGRTTGAHTPRNIRPGCTVKFRLGSQGARFPYLLATVAEVRRMPAVC